MEQPRIDGDWLSRQLWVPAVLVAIAVVVILTFALQHKAEVTEVAAAQTLPSNTTVLNTSDPNTTPTPEKSSPGTQPLDSTASADTAAPSSTEARNEEKLTCNVWATKLLNMSPEKRDEYAQQATEKAYEQVGSDILTNTAAGENNKYLLVSTTPEHEAELREFASGFVRAKSVRVNLCAQGFDEIQFLVRYDDGIHQKLLKRVKPSLEETLHYFAQTQEARPEP
jgi:hypothetical protein